MSKKTTTSSRIGNKPPLESKSLEFLLGECARLRRDLIALTTDSRPPPFPLSSSSCDDTIRIHGTVESRYREFEKSTKEEIKRLSSKKSINAQIIRQTPPRRQISHICNDTASKTANHRKSIKFRNEEPKKRNKLSTKLIKGVDIFPELSVEKLQSFEFVQARPKSNVGYYHFISQEDHHSTPSKNINNLVIQRVNNINILPEEMQKISLSENELEEGSLKSSSALSSVVEWHNTSFEESSEKSKASPPLSSIGSEESQKTASSCCSTAASSSRNNLTEFLQKADKTLIDKLPLDEKMKIIRRNLRSYEESLNENEKDPEEEEEDELLSTDSLCDFLRYALSGREESGKSYLSTIEERTENESSDSLSRRSRRSLEGELSRISHPSYDCNKADLSISRDENTLSEGQFLQKGSIHEDKTEMDDDDSSTDTFIISPGEWS